LGSQVNTEIDVLESSVHGFSISNISFDEIEIGVSPEIADVFVTAVAQIIQCCNAVGCIEKFLDHPAPNETGSAGHKSCRLSSPDHRAR
jgi:hypothetical protein